MGYIRAEEILPIEIIKLIQQYVDGENIYDWFYNKWNVRYAKKASG